MKSQVLHTVCDGTFPGEAAGLGENLKLTTLGPVRARMESSE